MKKEISGLLPVEPPPVLDTGGLKFPDMSEKKLFTPEDMEMDDGNTTMSAVGSSREVSARHDHTNSWFLYEGQPHGFFNQVSFHKDILSKCDQFLKSNRYIN